MSGWIRSINSRENRLDLLVVGSVIFITLWQLHPNLLFSSTLVTGGDTGSHMVLPAFLKSQGNLFNLTPWYPGWFAGMPAYTYYFVLPDVFATLASYVINFAVAFKLATILGSVLLPVTAYLMGRLFRAPRPVPAALAIATLPFLFDATFTIDGGNLFSSMAGEYAFSLSLALALLTIGLFARGVRTGHGYWLAAIALSATLASHVLPWFFCVEAVAVLVVFELLHRRGIGDAHDEQGSGDFARPLRFAIGAGALSAGLSAWWLLSFITSQQYTNSMGYTNDSVMTLHDIFTQLGWFTSSGAAAGDRWVIVLAAVAVVVAFWVRDRLGMVLSTLTVLSIGAFVFDPQNVIWNERLVPFWFITIHLSAGWLFGYALARWAARSPQQLARFSVQIGESRFSFQHEAAMTAKDSDIGAPAMPDGDPLLDRGDADVGSSFVDEFSSSNGDDREEPCAFDGGVESEQWKRSRRIARATIAILFLGLGTTLPGLIPHVASALSLNTTGNQVSSWAQWNYSGYQAKPAWPEYHDLMTTMSKVAKRYGCGRAMWEYNADQNRFGTPMALMLLPYWTNNCVDSMEGLYFESSATTPYHFLDQAELSVAPSNPMVGLPYGQLDVAFGVQHLQMLGVRYYIAYSPATVTQANRDPALKFVGQTKAWPTPGVRWRIYLITHSPMVQPLTHLPNVVANTASRVGWLKANTTWWLDETLWSTVAATSGPSNWPSATSVTTMTTSSKLPKIKVSKIETKSQSISFHVSKTGVPVLVKISYFSRWHANGATGPYRVSPNLMVVVPTSKNVSLVYTSTTALTVGNMISDVTTLAGFVTLGFVIRRRRTLRR